MANLATPLWSASLAATAPKGTNPETGRQWAPGEYEAAMAAIRAEALEMKGTGDLPVEPSRALDGTTQNWLGERR